MRTGRQQKNEPPPSCAQRRFPRPLPTYYLSEELLSPFRHEIGPLVGDEVAAAGDQLHLHLRRMPLVAGQQSAAAGRSSSPKSSRVGTRCGPWRSGRGRSPAPRAG